MAKTAVFLDRDGVINDNRKPVNKPADLKLYPWVAASIQRLNQAGFLVFVVTNQGGIELGYMTALALQLVHQRMADLLAEADAFIDEITYCPHYRTPCACRKPEPGMILTLAKKYDIKLSDSWMVGDREPDILAGKAAGCRTIKLGAADTPADYTCDRLDQAVDIILKC